MADGPMAPPSIYHRTNGDFKNGICVPSTHDDETCAIRGWLMSYPGAPRDDSLIESVREYMRELRK